MSLEEERLVWLILPELWLSLLRIWEVPGSAPSHSWRLQTLDSRNLSATNSAVNFAQQIFMQKSLSLSLSKSKILLSVDQSLRVNWVVRKLLLLVQVHSLGSSLFWYFLPYLITSYFLWREKKQAWVWAVRRRVCVLSLETLTPQRLSAVQLLSPCPKQDLLSSSKVSLALWIWRNGCFLLKMFKFDLYFQENSAASIRRRQRHKQKHTPQLCWAFSSEASLSPLKVLTCDRNFQFLHTSATLILVSKSLRGKLMA